VASDTAVSPSPAMRRASVAAVAVSWADWADERVASLTF
jgi:hypothetical protein